MVRRQKLKTLKALKAKLLNVTVVNIESDASEGESVEEVDPIFKKEVPTVKTQGKQMLTKPTICKSKQTLVTEISNYQHYLFLYKLIVFTVNQHENICIAGLNCQIG